MPIVNKSIKLMLKYEYDLIITMNADAATIALPHLQNVANNDMDNALDRLRTPKFSFVCLISTGSEK